jgi:fluoroacetyl-CoA thioesterase
LSHPVPDLTNPDGRMVGMDVGESATQRFAVTESDTAEALGSGALRVLATPRLLAWCEAVTCRVVDRFVEGTRTSVGTRVQLDHVSASPVGVDVAVTATVAYVDGRLVRFEVVGVQHPSSDEEGEEAEEKVVAHGEITRVVVDRDRFLSRLR